MDFHDPSTPVFPIYRVLGADVGVFIIFPFLQGWVGRERMTWMEGRAFRGRRQKSERI